VLAPITERRRAFVRVQRLPASHEAPEAATGRCAYSVP
jgi:hypothetical protein